jgi:hypothetical protein
VFGVFVCPYIITEAYLFEAKRGFYLILLIITEAKQFKGPEAGFILYYKYKLLALLIKPMIL